MSEHEISSDRGLAEDVPTDKAQMPEMAMRPGLLVMFPDDSEFEWLIIGDTRKAETWTLVATETFGKVGAEDIPLLSSRSGGPLIVRTANVMHREALDSAVVSGEVTQEEFDFIVKSPTLQGAFPPIPISRFRSQKWLQASVVMAAAAATVVFISWPEDPEGPTLRETGGTLRVRLTARDVSCTSTIDVPGARCVQPATAAFQVQIQCSPAVPYRWPAVISRDMQGRITVQVAAQPLSTASKCAQNFCTPEALEALPKNAQRVWVILSEQRLRREDLQEAAQMGDPSDLAGVVVYPFMFDVPKR